MGEQDLFRDLCEASHDLIQSVAPDGRFLYVNRSWLNTLGYREDEVAGLRVFDVIDPASRDHCEQTFRQVISGRPVEEVEATFRTKAGERVLVQGTARCRIEDGQPVATLGIFRDISQRRAVEQELDRLFNVSLDMMCIAGTDGYFKRINPAFEHVLGYTREELLSRSFVDFVHPDDRDSTLREVANLTRGRHVVDFQNRYRARDGSYRWLEWRSTAPEFAGGRVYATARDVTEDRRNRELLERQARELARSNADLEQFAYVASHDLQAPLRSVTNLAQWIEQDLDRGRRDKVAEHAQQLRSRVERMQELIDDLLTYSRAGKGPRQIETVNTQDLIDRIVALLSPLPGISVVSGPGMPVIDTVETPLEQVLRNLIANAIRHHDRSEGRITISATGNESFFEFAVTDDGPGIPESARDEVFEMFSRLGPRDGVEGTGMGLALVKRIVESFGGRVWVEPGSPRGAEFRFTWPRRIDPQGVSS